MIGLVMANANLPAKKYKKSNPTQIRLSFECDGGTTQFIDIARALSIINRKFYRQGVYYYVNSVEVYNNESGVIDLHTLPDTYVTKNSWNRGFQLFQKMNAMTNTPVSGVVRPKYHDFKVYFNSTHQQRGSINPVMTTINNGSAAYAPDEWDYSRFVSADSDGDLNQDNDALNQEADDFYVHMLGVHTGNSNNWTSVGLIKSYAESRTTVPNDDNINNVVDITDPLLNIFDFSSEEQINDIIENLISDNDKPPYDQNAYVGEISTSMQHVARIGTEVGVGRIGRAAGFCAPMGLICVDPWDVATGYRLVLNLAPGTYHGVYAERA
jgi:hypothetical protein